MNTDNTRNICSFRGLSKTAKKKLIKEYTKNEWRNLSLSYFFIVLSSSKPFFSYKNGAVFVFIWFTLAILATICVYIVQSNYMNKNKKSKKYLKRHKNVKVQIGPNFFPEIGGWTFMAMQFVTAVLVYLIVVPISLYLQFNNFEMYKGVYRDFLKGILIDTYIVSSFNIILQIFIDFLQDCINNKVGLKKIISMQSPKSVISYGAAVIMLGVAFSYFFSSEFGGLFGDISRRIMGAIYIVFMLWPLFKCIKEIIDNKINSK